MIRQGTFSLLTVTFICLAMPVQADTQTDFNHSGTPIPATLFGLHAPWQSEPPVISYGTARLWDSGARWDEIGNCNPNDNTCHPQTTDCSSAHTGWCWTALDSDLAAIKKQCPTCDLTYTFGGIAQYANLCPGSGCPTGDPGGNACGNTRLGGCYLPPDLHSDGSGADSYITTYWSILATHLAGLDKNTYASVTSFSLGNEYDRDPCVDGGRWDPTACTVGVSSGGYTFVASYAQLQRMFADMKATVSPILTNAKFLNGSTYQNIALIQEMMYCKGSDKGGSCGCPNGGHGANYACQGSSVGLSGFVDGIDVHDYLGDGTGQGENVAGYISDTKTKALSKEDQQLPFWITELSFSHDDDLPDWDMQAGFAARLMVSCWSGGADRCYWYRYNSTGCHSKKTKGDTYSTGTMYDYTQQSNGQNMTNIDQCETGRSPGLWWDGKAYNQTYNWLVGSTLTQPCAEDSNHIFTCNLTSSNGTPEQIVWWAEPGASSTTWCQGSTPVTHGSCDNTSYIYPSTYTYYYTLDPAQCINGCKLVGSSVTITGMPILLSTVGSGSGSNNVVPSTPTLSLPPFLPMNAQISASYAGNDPAAYYAWSFTPVSQIPSGSGSGSLGIISRAQSANWTSPSPQTNLGSEPLSLGPYLVSVQVYDSNNNPSAPAQAYVTLVPSDLSGVRVFPNPWRSDKHGGLSITFDNLTVNTIVKIFTISGHWLKTLPQSSTSVTWDLTNDSGEKVASGLYVYLINTDSGLKKTGQLAVIK